MANLSPLPIQKFFDNNGRPLVGGKLFTYVAGTTTKTNTWKDADSVSLNTNPIIMDFRGECRLWIDPQQSYKFVLARSTDSDPPTNPIWTVDEITAAPLAFDNTSNDTGTVNNISLTIPQLGSAPVAFTRVVFKAANTNTGAMTLQINGGTALPLIWPNGEPMLYGDVKQSGMYQAIFDGGNWQLQGPRMYSKGDVRRYGVVGDGVANDTAAMQLALNAGGTLTAPGGLTILIFSALACSVAKTVIDLGGSTMKFSALYDDAGTGDLIMISVSAVDVQVRNTFFDGSAKSAESDRNTFVQYTNGANRGVVHNCRFVSLADGGTDGNCAVMFLTGADDGDLSHCTFDDCPGAGFSQGARPKFVNNTVTTPKDVSFALNGTNCFGGSVLGNKVFGDNTTVSGHIAAEEGASAWVIANNYVYGVKDGGGILALNVAVTTDVIGGIIANNIVDGNGNTTTNPSSLISVSTHYRGCRIIDNILQGMPAGLSNNVAIAAPAFDTYICGNRIDATTGSSAATAVLITPAGGRLDFFDNTINVTGGPVRHVTFNSGSNSGIRVFFKGGTFIGGTTAIDTALNSPTNMPVWLENLTQSSATNVLDLTGTDSIETFFNTQNAITQPHSIKARRSVYGNAIPTQGSWVQGDKVWMIGPTASNTPGWVCVADGTPGTWKLMANLSA